MKKIIAALLLFVGISAANAQSYPSPQFVTQPSTTNSNLAATTSFVNSAIANLGVVVGTVSSNAGLQTLSVSNIVPGNVVLETGFYTAGDMTPAYYVYSASACATTSYGAAETPAISGGCFNVIPGNTLDVRWFGPVSGGSDPNNNNATLLNQFFNYYATLHPSNTFDAPVVEWAGLMYGVQATVIDDTYNDLISHGPMLKALGNLGGGAPNAANPSGGNVCPAILRIVNNGIHEYDNPQFDGNYQPVYLFSQEVNGTIHIVSPQGKHWLGSCGGPTPQTGNEVQGSNIVTMSNTTGYIPGQVIHETTGNLPFNEQIIRVDTNTDIVLRLPANVTSSEPIYAYNDSGGLAWGLPGSNAGGSILGQANVNQFQTGDADLGVPYYQDGYSFFGTGNTNDIQVSGGLYENASAAMFFGPGTSAHFAGHNEINNDASVSATSTASTIASGILTVGGTINGTGSCSPNCFKLGMSITYTGISGGPYYIEPGGTGTGGAGTYDLSGSPADVSTATAINATSAQPTPAGILMAAGAGNMVLDGPEFNGANLQVFASNPVGTINIDMHSAKYTGSNYATGMNDIVQAWTDQTNTPLSGMNVNLFAANLISGLGYIAQTGPGTWSGTNNQFAGPLNIQGAIAATTSITAGSNSAIKGGDIVVQGTAVPGNGWNLCATNDVCGYANSTKTFDFTSTQATLSDPLAITGSMNASGAVTAGTNSVISGGDLLLQGNGVPANGWNVVIANDPTLYANATKTLDTTTSLATLYEPVTVQGGLAASGYLTAGTNSIISGGDIVVQGTLVPANGWNLAAANDPTLYANATKTFDTTTTQATMDEPLAVTGAVNATGAVTAGSNSLISGGDIVVQGTIVPANGWNLASANDPTLYANATIELDATTTNTTVHNNLIVNGSVSGAGVTTLLAPYAPLASPALTGSPTAPTQTTSDSSTDIATDAFVQNNLASYLTTGVASATYLPTATAASTYAPLASPSLTGLTKAVNLAVTGNLFQSQSSSPITSTGNATITVAQFTTGLITRSGETANVTDTTPTATALNAAISGLPNNSTLPETFTNNNTSYSETISPAAGVTINGTAVVQPGSSNTYIVNYNAGAGTVTMQFMFSSVLASGGTFSGQITSTASVSFAGINFVASGYMGAPRFAVTGSIVPGTAGIYQPAANQLGFASNTTAAGLIDANQHWRIGGSGTPTVSCNGSGTATVTGNDQSFLLVIGSGATTACTVTFASAFTTAPRSIGISAEDSAAAAIGTTQEYYSGLSTTQVIINGAALANAAYGVQVW